MMALPRSITIQAHRELSVTPLLSLASRLAGGGVPPRPASPQRATRMSEHPTPALQSFADRTRQMSREPLRTSSQSNKLAYRSQ